MSKLTPERAALIGRIGGHALHARVDSREHTAPARAAFLARFLEEVDPNRELPEAERVRRAEHAREAYFSRLALARHESARKKRTSGKAA